MSSYPSALRRFAIPVLGLLAGMVPGMVRAQQLQTTTTMEIRADDPTGGASVGLNVPVAATAKTLVPPSPPAAFPSIQGPATDTAISASASVEITDSGNLPSVQDFQVGAGATNVVNLPNPQVAVPTSVISSEVFSTDFTWQLQLPTSAILNPSAVLFDGNTYNLSEFGIKVSTNFSFNYSIMGNAQTSATVNLAGEAFPNADLSTGTLGTGAGLSQWDEACTIATNPAAEGSFMSFSGSHGGIVQCLTSTTAGFAGTASITINPGLDAANLVGALLGTNPDVMSLSFLISASAEAAGNDFNSSYTNVDGECNSAADPINCLVSGAGANLASVFTTDPEITSINMIDANGQIVPFFTFETLDGIGLPSGEPTSSVPEPSSAWILGAGLIALLGSLRISRSGLPNLAG